MKSTKHFYLTWNGYHTEFSAYVEGNDVEIDEITVYDESNTPLSTLDVLGNLTRSSKGYDLVIEPIAELEEMVRTAAAEFASA